MFCFFELSGDGTSLQFEECKQTPGQLIDEMEDYGPGFILYRALYKKQFILFAIMNLHHSCQVRARRGNSWVWKHVTDPNCSSEDIEQELAKFYQPLQTAINVVFPDVGQVQFVTRNELGAKGDEYNIKDFQDFKGLVPMEKPAPNN